jgi:hypothetical protein
MKIGLYIHTYHTRFTLDEIAEASQILLRDAHVCYDYDYCRDNYKYDIVIKIVGLPHHRILNWTSMSGIMELVIRT